MNEVRPVDAVDEFFALVPAVILEAHAPEPIVRRRWWQHEDLVPITLIICGLVLDLAMHLAH